MVGHLYGALVEGDHRRHAAFNEFSFESRNSRGETVSFDCKADGAWNMCVRIVRRTLLSTLYKSGEMGLKGF